MRVRCSVVLSNQNAHVGDGKLLSRDQPRSCVTTNLPDSFLPFSSLCCKTCTRHTWSELATSQKWPSAMDLTIPTLDPPSGVNERADGQSAFESLDNVLALLDEKRSRQLVQGVIPAVTYTGDFEVVGRDDRLDPPTQLCSPCKELIQRPPPIYQFTDMKDTPPAQFWVPHHDTLFQLIDCCFSRSGSCRLCQLLWHGVCRENRRLRSLRHGNKNVAWPDDTLKIALKANEIQFRQIFLGLNIFLEQNIHLTITCSRSSFSDYTGTW